MASPAASITNLPLTLEDVQEAAERIAGAVVRTPMMHSATLSERTGADVYVKLENLQFTGAYKERGALNRLLLMEPEQRARGVIAASAGNHAQALAYHARRLGVPAVIVMPAPTPSVKVSQTERHGAEIVLEGETFDEALACALRLAEDRGLTFVPPFDHPQIMAGAGTVALEMLGDQPDLDVLVVPIGGGGLIGGSAIAAKGIFPRIRIIAAEPEGAADAFESLRRGMRVIDIVPDTICDGLRATFGEINFALLREYGVEVLQVSDAQTVAAMRLVYERLKIVIEPSSAVVLAAILRHRERFAGLRVGAILSGGNVDLDRLPWMP